MQPYFLPHGGYFSLIASCDTWVVFDDAQMIRHGWVDRNRVLHPNEGWQYIASGTDPEPDGDFEWIGTLYEGELPPYGPLEPSAE